MPMPTFSIVRRCIATIFGFLFFILLSQGAIQIPVLTPIAHYCRQFLLLLIPLMRSMTVFFALTYYTHPKFKTLGSWKPFAKSAAVLYTIAFVWEGFLIWAAFMEQEDETLASVAYEWVVTAGGGFWVEVLLLIATVTSVYSGYWKGGKWEAGLDKAYERLIEKEKEKEKENQKKKKEGDLEAGVVSEEGEKS